MKAQSIGDWVVVRTNIRCERRACRSLRAAGYKVYYPTFRKSVLHRRTKKRIIRRYSMMPGYILVRMTKLDWFTLRRCDGVEAVLGVRGEPYAISTAEVAHMMQTQRSRKMDSVYVEKVSGKQRQKHLAGIYFKGRRVRAKEGPMAGMYLEVDSVTAQGRISAMMSLFGRLTPVEFEETAIEPLDNALAA